MGSVNWYLAGCLSHQTPEMGLLGSVILKLSLFFRFFTKNNLT